MIELTQPQKSEFLHEHLGHRLTLLRTLRERNRNGHDYKDQGDIYRCVKDSNLIAVRLILDFLGLKGKFENSKYELTSNSRKTNSKYQDDIMIDQFIGQLISPNEVPASSRRILAGVYLRADKELAHLTSTFNDEFNREDVLIESATIIENLLQKYLYDYLGEHLPKMDL
jgi:hypothetical protein